ncbi:MAG: DUF2922 family protein [Defluviitaleaceae bacterium]|nr:DUF2922 family protein [Defluviitaleaceae bacterium]
MTHYQLTFVTTLGTRRTFRVNNVDPDIPQQDLQDAVDLLLAHNIMSPERGALSRLQTLAANTVSSVNLLG